MGEPFPVAPNATSASVAANGTLVYLVSSSDQWQLVWRDRGGKKLAVAGQPQQEIWDPDLSPDEQRVVVASVDNGRDLWFHDVAGPMKSRFTFDEAWDALPIWAPSGNHVAYSSGPDPTRTGIFSRSADRSGEPTALGPSSGWTYVLDWSADEEYLLYWSEEDLWYLERKDEGSTYEAAAFSQTEFRERAGEFSPDGRYVAYSSNETGRHEVYVQLFPGGGGKLQVSGRGGGQPRWSKDGREIFYVEGDTLVTVPVTTTPSFSVGSPRRLFPSAGLGRMAYRDAGAVAPQYDVSADGQRFVIVEPVEEPATLPIIRVVQNWFEEFRDRQGGAR